MLNKIFPIALAIAVFAIVVLAFLAYSQLQSVGFAPTVISANYLSFEGYYGKFLWISSLILLILANILLWTQRKSWALWATLGYFALFLMLKGWWLDKVFFDYQQENNLAGNYLFTSGLISAVICIVAAIAVYFDQFLVIRLHEKMYKPEPIANDNFIEEDSTEKEDLTQIEAQSEVEES